MLYSTADAAFSPCGHYRWMLRRSIRMPSRDDPCKLLLFVGLNPSLADAGRDDPTLRRLQGFARDWGYHQLVVLNVFGRISPSPRALRRCDDSVGLDTDPVLNSWFQSWSRSPACDLWLGWGEAGSLYRRDDQVVTMLATALALRFQGAPPLVIGTTRSGQPRHPLYVAAGSRLFPWACTVR
ncbi:hypothetical protein SynBIOSU31_02522 [Synechococcus sp. BIOS-U3-1]|uniref:DUF1643 domain-containing protein n=1 Tax=Synechococcus sp. BIOS-U3-1 TaxID=1400865 RepID=UPI001860D12E|nr:DUF1643 domain-containing protein [Synechococcus sp. BIOS-U3-1]QNI59386.1 hypothetical protein SynBIOSU31_02522 [Synechococcus sp. BIOS-U3-1]